MKQLLGDEIKEVSGGVKQQVKTPYDERIEFDKNQISIVKKPNAKNALIKTLNLLLQARNEYLEKL